MSPPVAFSLYIAPKILHEQRGFQAHFNLIQDQSWPDILDFTLLPFMWFNKNTSQLSQLHSHVHVTVMSLHITHSPHSFFHFTILNQQFFLIIYAKLLFVWLELLFFFPSWLEMFMLTNLTEIPTICSYLFSPLYPLHRYSSHTAPSVTLLRRHRQLLVSETQAFNFTFYSKKVRETYSVVSHMHI